MAFVLIQHLDPSHESHLTELLSKASKMPVSEVKGETRAEANHVYVIPPRCNLSISDGVLHTPPRPASGRNMPIDSFLQRPGGRPGQQGPRRRSVGNRIRWDAGPPGDQGRGRHHLRSGSANREVRRHAAKRHRRRCGGFCPAAGRNRAATGGHRARFSGRRSSLGRRRSRRGMRTWPRYSGWCGTPPEWTSRTTSTAPSTRRIKRRMALRGFESLEDYSRDLEQNREEASRVVRELLYHRHRILSGTGGLRGTEEEGVPRAGRESGSPRIRSGSGCPGAPRARRLIRSPSA